MSRKNEEPTLFQKYADLMNQNIKGVQIGCYSVAFIGLGYALRRVRPFSRFKKPTDVPTRFIKDRIELLGTVKRIEPNGTLLIDHKPLIPVPIVSRGELPTKIANIELNGHGISWLQTLVAGNEVKFIPISKNENVVECQFKLPQKILDKKKKKMVDETIDLGVSLVSIDFGNLIEKPINKHDLNYMYYRQLEVAKEKALRKKLGIKYYIKPTKLIMAMILNQLNIAIKVLLRKISGKQQLPKAITA